MNSRPVTFTAGTKIKSAEMNLLMQVLYGLRPGHMLNGKISVTVASNNLTLALKTLAGADPSATDPIYANIGGTVYAITAALSVTKNAGTNWFGSGGSMFATLEMDYFAYLGYNATDGVTIGFARIPYGTLYSTFSTTSTDEKYCAISNIAHAAAGDNYEVIGRFAATLSAGAGYTWTVPTFTNANLIQKPIYESEWRVWNPTWTGLGTLTYTSVTGVLLYKITRNTIMLMVSSNGTVGGAGTTILASLPFATLEYDTGMAAYFYDSGIVLGGVYLSDNTHIAFSRVTGNWGTGAAKYARIQYSYRN